MNCPWLHTACRKVPNTPHLCICDDILLYHRDYEAFMLTWFNICKEVPQSGESTNPSRTAWENAELQASTNYKAADFQPSKLSLHSETRTMLLQLAASQAHNLSTCLVSI